MSNSSEYKKYLSVEDHLRSLLREGKRDPRTVRQQLEAIIMGSGELRSAAPGSEIVLTLGNCQDFLVFSGAKEVRLATFIIPPKPEGFYWPVPCSSYFSYDRLADLLVKLKVPHYDWVPEYLRMQVDRRFDCRKAGDVNYLLWTPAGIDSREACPQLRGQSYHQLWKSWEQILTLREIIILWMLIYWKTSYQVKLDPMGWTRTGSRDGDGLGADVLSGDSGLNVNWGSPVGGGPGGSARLAVSG